MAINSADSYSSAARGLLGMTVAKGPTDLLGNKNDQDAMRAAMQTLLPTQPMLGYPEINSVSTQVGQRRVEERLVALLQSKATWSFDVVSIANGAVVIAHPKDRYEAPTIWFVNEGETVGDVINLIQTRAALDVAK